MLLPAGHPWFISVLALVLVCAMALGPAWYWEPVNRALLTAGIGLLILWHVVVMRWPRLVPWLPAGYLAIFVAIAVGLILFLTPGSSAGPRPPQRLHVGVVVAPYLCAALGLAALFARWTFRHDAWPGGLERVELFDPNDRFEASGSRPAVSVGTSLLLPLLRFPVVLLFFGAAPVVVWPNAGPQWHNVEPRLVVFVTGVLFAWFLLFWGMLYDRLMELFRTVGRLFFVGPQRIVTFFVIMIGISLVARFHYISYLFDAGLKGDKTLLAYIALCYALAWFYGFLCDILLARRFLSVLESVYATNGFVRYDLDEDKTALSKVENEGRKLYLHGGGRIRVEGRYDASDVDKGKPAYGFLTTGEFLQRFREQVAMDEKSTTLSLAQIRNAERAARAFPALASALILVPIVVLALVNYRGGLTLQPAELELVRDKHIDLDLERLIVGDGAPASRTTEDGWTLDHARAASGRCPTMTEHTPRIAIAASGGGTRAAIYTASLLRGLAERDLICNVVLVSGVSGGSAALAYFALHPELRVPRKAMSEPAWEAFDAAMARSYIGDVIDAASSLPVAIGTRRWDNSVCGEPKVDPTTVSGIEIGRVRFGTMLAESFACTFVPAGSTGAMQDVPFGLVLNTGLLGRFEPGYRVESLAIATRNEGTSDVAGNRLVFTNLPGPGTNVLVPLAPKSAVINEVGTFDLRAVFINDPEISVSRAAALSANFPPVFANAAVDELEAASGGDGRGDKRFWVTDGGTVENRGVVTLYLALRDALPPHPATQLPPLMVIVADVSPKYGNYGESFGFGSLMSAGGQVGLALEAELGRELARYYQENDSKFTVHDLTLPIVLHGGIGTHWMLPSELTFTGPVRREAADNPAPSDQALEKLNLLSTAAASSEPTPASVSEEGAVTISDKQVQLIVRRMHSLDPNAGDISLEDPEFKQLSGWISEDAQGPDSHAGTWKKLVGELGKR